MEINEYLNNIESLLNNYKEEIPNIMLTSTMEDSNYKVRDSWFAHISFEIEIGILRGILDEEFNSTVDALFDYFKKSNFHNRLTTKKDIEIGNYVLEEVKKYVERRYHNNDMKNT